MYLSHAGEISQPLGATQTQADDLVRSWLSIVWHVIDQVHRCMVWWDRFASQLRISAGSTAPTVQQKVPHPLQLLAAQRLVASAVLSGTQRGFI